MNAKQSPTYRKPQKHAPKRLSGPVQASMKLLLYYNLLTGDTTAERTGQGLYVGTCVDHILCVIWPNDILAKYGDMQKAVILL